VAASGAGGKAAARTTARCQAVVKVMGSAWNSLAGARSSGTSGPLGAVRRDASGPGQKSCNKFKANEYAGDSP
jgi:hypothetical protein